MIDLSIGTIGLEKWFGGQIAPVIDLVRTADRLGIDQVTLTDHVIMSSAVHTYPYGRFPGTLDEPWFEPISVLSAIASATSRITLSTGILIAPLRPAVLLAKQLATLDVLSNGRVQIGLGVGWQREEYEAASIPWDGRFNYMDEQVKVCQSLWRAAPTSFHGKYVNFDALTSLPFPAQKNGIPILLGVAPTARNFERIADYADGWLPMEKKPEILAAQIEELRKTMTRRGRTSESLVIRVTPSPALKSDGMGDIDATLRTVQPLIAAGVTALNFPPAYYCRDAEGFEPLMNRLLEWRSRSG